MDGLRDLHGGRREVVGVSEIRQDEATKRWVIMATERARRPSDLAAPASQAEDLPEYSPTCPFCPGNEGMTPPEVFAFRDADGEPDSPGWQVRIVPNAFPALSPEGQVRIHDPHGFTHLTGVGAHEVIIETPLHSARPPDTDVDDVARILAAAGERFEAFRRDKRLSYVAFFRNHGLPAGSSLTHPHTQIIATPIVPTNIRQEIEEARRYYDDRMGCVYCATIHCEQKAGDRVVMDTNDLFVFEPYASRWPFETWIMPKRHSPMLTGGDPTTLLSLAYVLQCVLDALYEGLGDPAYNLVLHEAPLRDTCEDYYHWHIEILPRLATAAGFELGTGIWINSVLPEEAAEYLRALVPQQPGRTSSLTGR
jgi:UDPglucose--hexose-1-phosphate uridylyltransferase